MAEVVKMSVSAFHRAFKDVTETSPLHYIKEVRLHKARLHIKYDGLAASVTAAKVGYVSTSQFSREFKRFFGHSPTKESARREALMGRGRARRRLAFQKTYSEPEGTVEDPATP